MALVVSCSGCDSRAGGAAAAEAAVEDWCRMADRKGVWRRGARRTAGEDVKEMAVERRTPWMACLTSIFLLDEEASVSVG